MLMTERQIYLSWHGFCMQHLPMNAKYPRKGFLANSVGPDRTPQNAESDQDLYSLHLYKAGTSIICGTC